MITPLRDRAHDIVTTEKRAVIFHNPKDIHPWQVYLPYEWPSIDGFHTDVFTTYAAAAGFVAAALHAIRLREALVAGFEL